VLESGSLPSSQISLLKRMSESGFRDQSNRSLEQNGEESAIAGRGGGEEEAEEAAALTAKKYVLSGKLLITSCCMYTIGAYCAELLIVCCPSRDLHLMRTYGAVCCVCLAV